MINWWNEGDGPAGQEEFLHGTHEAGLEDQAAQADQADQEQSLSQTNSQAKTMGDRR